MEIDERKTQLGRAATLCARAHELPTDRSSAELEWRLGLKKALSSKDVHFYNPCNLNEILVPGSVKVFTSKEKASASESVIVAGVLNYPRTGALAEKYREYWEKYKCDIIMKVTFRALYSKASPGRVDPLRSEIYIYEFLSKLVEARVTPNLVISLGVFYCTFEQLAGGTGQNSAELQQLLQEAQKVYAGKGRAIQGRDAVRFLMLERGRGTSFGEMLEQNRLNENQVISLLFQVIYTLMVLTERGVRHADLHLGNVFVDLLSDKQTTLDYFPKPSESSQYAHIPTLGVFAKLFDWDWGGIYATRSASNTWPRPTQLIANDLAVRNCTAVSSCNANNKADAYIFLSSLYDYVYAVQRMPKVIAFLERVIDPSLMKFGSPDSADNFERRGGFQFRFCAGPIANACQRPPVLTQQGCVAPWDNVPDCLMKTPLQMLQDQIFANVWRDARTNPPSDCRYVYGNWSKEKQYRKMKKDCNL